MIILSTHFFGDLTFRIWLLECNLILFWLKVIRPTSQPDYLRMLWEEGGRWKSSTHKCSSNTDTWYNNQCLLYIAIRCCASLHGLYRGSIGILGGLTVPCVRMSRTMKEVSSLGLQGRPPSCDNRKRPHISTTQCGWYYYFGLKKRFILKLNSCQQLNFPDAPLKSKNIFKLLKTIYPCCD